MALFDELLVELDLLLLPHAVKHMAVNGNSHNSSICLCFIVYPPP